MNDKRLSQRIKALSVHIDSVILTKHFRYEFFEDAVEVSLIPKKSHSVLWWIFRMLISLAFLGVSLLLFIRGLIVYGILGLIATAILVGLVIYADFRIKSRDKIFQLVLMSDGVFYIDHTAQFFICWEKIKQFGFVNKTTKYDEYSELIPGICLYFSCKECDEGQLKKEFHNIDFLRYSHYASDELIAFASFEKSIPEQAYERINEFIKSHCAEEKELSYCDKMW